jgi:hypothetical protein
MQLQQQKSRTIISNTAPNTPEALRRGSLRDKREKMEYNQMMMRSLTETQQNNHRPLSYHGSLTNSTSGIITTTTTPVNKRHIVSNNAVLNGMGRNKKESLLLNRRSMPIPYLENRLRDKIGEIFANYSKW